MNSKQSILAVAVVALLSLTLTSCSGVKTPCTVNCGPVSGNASLNVTLAAEPLTPPPGTSILSFAVVINSISLTPSSGNAVTIPLNNSSITVDLTRLTSDSAYLGQYINSVPAATYTTVTVGITSAIVTYCTATSGTPGCNSNSITQVTSVASAPAATISLTLSANQQAGLRVVLNFNNALTVNSNTQAVTGVDLTAANVITTLSLPPALSTLSTGQLDYVEDVTGVVTAASSSSVTVQTATLGTVTSTINGSTIPSESCVILNTACTPTVGQVASIDATLNSDGTSTALQYDLLSSSSVDLIEGIVTAEPTVGTQFQMVTNDYIPANSNSRISRLNLGDTVNVTLANGVNPFYVDSKNLTVYGGFQGSMDTSAIHTGMTVMLRVTSFTARSGNTPASATVDAVVLRFTRFAASAAATGAPQFAIGSLPPFFGISIVPIVQLGTGSPITYLDGYTTSGSISSGDNLGIRALYFGPTVTPAFTAAKIRKN